VIPPDNEIFEVESRIAAHRAQLKRSARETKARALQKMASPGALAAAAALGFLAAAAMARRNRKPSHPERRKSDHLKAAKATGIAGMLLPAAMWLVRAQWGSPVRAAQVLLEKMGRKKPALSPRADTKRDTRSTIHP
jgi:hypothetical protein